MGLLRYLRGQDILENSTESRALPKAENQYPLSWNTGEPVRTVTTGNALQIADAYSCVRVLADSISTLPLKAFRRTDAGRVPAGDDQRLVQLLRRPSPGSTSVDLVSQIVTHLAIYGEAFIGKFKSDREIVQLALLHPEQVQVELLGQRIVYTLNGRTEHGVDDVLHIKGLSSDGVRGISPITQCRTALGLNENLRESGRQFFKQGSLPSGVLVVLPGTPKENIDRFYEDWKAKQEGLDNMHKVAVIEGDMDFKPVAFSATDNQFLETREFSTREICRIFRVPAWAVDGASGDSMTYANVSEQARALVTYSLRPWIVRIETAFSSDADLCPGSTYCEFDLDGLLRANPTDRAAVYTAALNSETGWLNRAEVRALENMPAEPATPRTDNSDATGGGNVRPGTQGA